VTVYRVQPPGVELHAIETETSAGNPAGGVHVFTEIGQVEAAIGWITRLDVELAEIECERRDLRPNGDYEGDLLIAGRGRIVRRHRFRDTGRVARWAEIRRRREEAR
jgi:hypothetical protein